MIQRIQSLYLFIVFVLLVVCLCLPVGHLVGTDGLVAAEFTNLHLALNDVTHQTFGLFGILLVSAIIALGTIFMFHNRVLQIRMTIFSSILLIGYYLTVGAFWWVLVRDLEFTFNISWSLSLPFICIIFNYLAIRGIGKDEVMVKAADRFR